MVTTMTTKLLYLFAIAAPKKVWEKDKRELCFGNGAINERRRLQLHNSATAIE